MTSSSATATLARELAQLSAQEMLSALGASQAPRPLRRGLALALFAVSRRLGSTLATFDLSVNELGLPEAARRALEHFRVGHRHTGDAVGPGPSLVLANHPGAYDALALMSAIGRTDLAIVAADRAFLRALPGLARHLLFVGETPSQRASALKRALSWLRRGGALLHFPAGCIEPDADFEAPAADLLRPWQPGVSSLVRALERVDGTLHVAGVRGVHSPRAKGLFLNRWAERRGVSTLSPLIQMVAGLDDVATRVCIVEVARPSSSSPVGEQEAQLRRALVSAIRRA
jgi:1-acyl-sn-glycerol-3-phosphate acyltransferase